MFYLILIPVLLGGFHYINKQVKIEKSIKIILAIVSIIMIALVLIDFLHKII